MLSRVAIVCCLGLGLTAAVFATARAPVVTSSAHRVTEAVAHAGGPRHLVKVLVEEPIRRALADARNPRDQKPRLY